MAAIKIGGLNMKIQLYKKLLLPATTLGVLLALILACEDSTNPVFPALEIPPLSTFMVDFNTFWDAVIVAHIAIPAAAYVESFNHTPHLDED
jgi:hypothetical protein